MSQGFLGTLVCISSNPPKFCAGLADAQSSPRRRRVSLSDAGAMDGSSLGPELDDSTFLKGVLDTFRCLEAVLHTFREASTF